VAESPPNNAQSGSQDESEPLQYPANHVIGILDTQDQTACAVDGLVTGGFLESEIELLRGAEEADRLDQTTGRRGLVDLTILLFQRIGLENAEIEMKERYEEALRDGRTVIAILTPTDERKDRAVQILKECGGHFINFYGRLAVQRISG
jgi:hypothetical protein